MKLFRKILVSLAAVFVLHSTHASPTTPPLSRDQMVNILVDLELAKALVERYSADEATTQQWLGENVLRIYQTHNTTPEDFQDSYQYYLAHPEVMVELYEAVVNKLEHLFMTL